MAPVASHERGRRPVLLYDGDCGFCTRCAELLDRWVRTSATLTPWQLADLDALGTTPSRAEREVLWVGTDGRIEGGAAAVARVLRTGGRGWRVLGVLLSLPPVRWLGSVLYRLIAHNRHRLPGGTPACALPAEKRPGAGRGR
jgi:predicted DCC family thiol-disulfide oxidoreductase YuxK